MNSENQSHIEVDGAQYVRADIADEYKAKAERLEDELNNPRLSGMHLYQHTLQIGMEGGPVQMFAEAFAAQFKGAGAKNYIEMTLRSLDDDIGNLIVIMQRVNGKSPHQLRMYAEQALPAAAEAMRAAILAEMPPGGVCDPHFLCEAIRALDINKVIAAVNQHDTKTPYTAGPNEERRG